ncbi:histidine kinase [Spirosoma sp. BT702]|uniref:Oxygen sensor histidine kinase NreB n=2 Tax=Spirosoma profusum TaxID=2771354 RepID=A0A926XUR3_9BACT|nr:histidine kinase [Spirosoma profusum]
MRTIPSICIHLLFWSSLLQDGWAQATERNTAPSFRISHIGVSDGLTQGSVYAILKDSRGFLWFGTQDGLNRYDGQRFRTYHPTIGRQGAIQAGTIRGNNIFGIVEDPDGNLWIGTEAGLNRYDRQRDQFTFVLSSTTESKKKRLSSRTFPFFIDKTQLLYLSDAEGLVRYDYRKGHKTVLFNQLSPTKEYDLYSSPIYTAAGDVWLQASTGLLRYNIPTQKLSAYFSNHPQNQFGPPTTIYSFHIDANNVAWLGTQNGLLRFDYGNNTYQNYPIKGLKETSAVFSIAADGQERLWLGTQRNGVIYFDKRGQTFSQVQDFTNTVRQLNEFKISKIFVDDLGIVWANTDPDGLVRIVPGAFLFGGMVKRQVGDSLRADRQLSSYTIRGFLEERFDRLWVLTENGINILNPATNRIVERFLSLSPTPTMPQGFRARSLYRDPQRRIWAGIAGGVLTYQPTTKTFSPILWNSANQNSVANNYVRNLTGISDSLLVAATEDGLYALNPNRRSWSKLPILTNQNIFSLWYNSSTQQLWVGTYRNGYYCYQVSDKGWRMVRSGLNGYTILNIRPDTDKQTLWLSSDRGLVAMNAESGRFRLYSEQNGLANSFVYGSLSDAQHNTWMSTNRGIARLDPISQTIKNFDPKDGLQGYEFNGNAFLKTANGDLYFGGVTGFNHCRPDAFRKNLFNPRVHIYSLSINEEPFHTATYIGETNSLNLTHTQNTLALEFSAFDYFCDGHTNYQYQLTGYDDNWVMSGERNYVRYANLPPGQYVFQVRATNQDNRWSHYVRRVSIYIEPPFWQKPAFITLLLLIIVGTVWAWIRQREHNIRQQQVDRLRLAYDIQEQVKKEIARDLHDEIGTRLATIKLYTTQLTQEAGETSSIRALKTTIFQLINDTISDVRNLLRKLNPQTLEQHGYVATVEELFSRINASGIISALFTYDEITESADRFPADTEVMLYRITQELVNNSLKHATPKCIDLKMRQQPGRIILAYTDDGSGFNYEQAKKSATGLGISNIESRVALLNGQISWQSKPGQGVLVSIEVPVSPVHQKAFYKSPDKVEQTG